MMLTLVFFVLFAAAAVVAEKAHIYQPAKELMKELDKYGKLKENLNNDGSSRIVNGNDVSISYHPWQISLRRLGSHHENYNPTGAGIPNDIAILLLDGSLTFNSNVQPATLPDPSFYPSSGCVMTGWGRTNIGTDLPDILQEAFVDPISNFQCRLAMFGISGATIHDYHICPHNGQRMSCNGDSGGPYSCYDGSRYVLTGITSWGIQSNGQCSLSYPSVYVRVTHFLNWINQYKNL